MIFENSPPISKRKNSLHSLFKKIPYCLSMSGISQLYRHYQQIFKHRVDDNRLTQEGKKPEQWTLCVGYLKLPQMILYC